MEGRLVICLQPPTLAFCREQAAVLGPAHWPGGREEGHGLQGEGDGRAAAEGALPILGDFLGQTWVWSSQGFCPERELDEDAALS